MTCKILSYIFLLTGFISFVQIFTTSDVLYSELSKGLSFISLLIAMKLLSEGKSGRKKSKLPE